MLKNKLILLFSFFLSLNTTMAFAAEEYLQLCQEREVAPNARIAISLALRKDILFCESYEECNDIVNSGASVSNLEQFEPTATFVPGVGKSVTYSNPQTKALAASILRKVSLISVSGKKVNVKQISRRTLDREVIKFALNSDFNAFEQSFFELFSENFCN